MDATSSDYLFLLNRLESKRSSKHASFLLFYRLWAHVRGLVVSYINCTDFISLLSVRSMGNLFRPTSFPTTFPSHSLFLSQKVTVRTLQRCKNKIYFYGVCRDGYGMHTRAFVFESKCKYQHIGVCVCVLKLFKGDSLCWKNLSVWQLFNCYISIRTVFQLMWKHFWNRPLRDTSIKVTEIEIKMY